MAAGGEGAVRVARILARGLAVTLLLVCLLGGAVAGESAGVRAVDSVALTVSDLNRSVDFYSRILDFEKVSEVELAGEGYERLRNVSPARMRVARLRLGGEAIELTQYLAPSGRPAPADARSNDRWFQHIAIVVADMDRAYQRLHAQQVAHISPAPQRLPDWNPDAGGIRAFYFKDPDGHPLELIWFPPGRGDPRWQQPGEQLFRGIDHTAIAVGDTAASLAFYRDRLGFRVAGGSENSGPEQELLNGVRGSRVRITSLRAPSGPGIELLEYLAPRDGRPFPTDERASDLVHWQTRLVLDGGALPSLDHAPPVELPERELGFRRAIAMRDPDQHALELVEP